MDYLQYLKEFDNSPWIAVGVLNLVINGLPSIPNGAYLYDAGEFIVLNLVINGLPSIRKSGLELSLQ